RNPQPAPARYLSVRRRSESDGAFPERNRGIPRPMTALPSRRATKRSRKDRQAGRGGRRPARFAWRSRGRPVAEDRRKGSLRAEPSGRLPPGGEIAFGGQPWAYVPLVVALFPSSRRRCDPSAECPRHSAEGGE